MSGSRAITPTPGSLEFVVVTSFTAFRVHAEECPPCAQVHLSIIRGWDWAERRPQRQDGSQGDLDPARPIPMGRIFSSWWERACPAGRQLLRAWHEACQEAAPLPRGRAA